MLAYDSALCVGCMRCASVCPQGVHRTAGGKHVLCREACMRCGACAAACPQGALSIPMRELSEEELLAVAARQERLLGKDGGITFSGGEPLLYGEEICRLAPRLGTHVAIETSGYAVPDLFSRVVEAVDYVMMDLKLADDEIHQRYTGVSNHTILENLSALRESGKPFLLRTPLIPGITDTEDNLAALARIVGNDPWERLPYHSAAEEKHTRLGLSYLLTHREP